MHKLRNDIILIASILCIALICIILFNILAPKNNLKACVYSNNELVLELSLNQEKEYSIHGAIGEIKIKVYKDGVEVISSDCEDKICVHQGKINRANQTITCLPNKIYIKLVGDKEGADVVL